MALAYLFGSQRELGLRLLHGEPAGPSEPLADLDLGVVFEGPLPGPDRRYRLYSEIYNAFTDLFPGLPLDLDYEHRILARAADFRPGLGASRLHRGTAPGVGGDEKAASFGVPAAPERRGGGEFSAPLLEAKLVAMAGYRNRLVHLCEGSPGLSGRGRPPARGRSRPIAIG